MKIYLFVLAFTLSFSETYAQDLLPVLVAKFGSEHVEFKDSSGFKEYYIIQFRQPVDHLDTTKGFFRQLVMLGHTDVNKVMVIETNGYSILPYQTLDYKTEAAQILDANQLIVEHRYFGQSIPDSTNNSWLNFEQIAGDYHSIKLAFSDIYPKSWVSTGASKGGTAALNYKYYYPDDVDASFVYVAPILTGLEDKCITRFLKEKRSTETGKKIFEIQKYFLQNKERLLPVFTEVMKYSGLSMGTMDPEILYDFAVLEFDFNYWQYISDFDLMLTYNRQSLDFFITRGFQDTSLLVTQTDSLLATFPSCIWFLLDKTLSDPYYYQAYTQVGSYGYKESLFKGMLKNKDYSLEFFAGDHPPYSWEYAKAFNRFLKHDLTHTIFIYGADDPWTACQANISPANDNLLFVNAGANHNTLLKDLGDSEKLQVIEKLSTWLNSTVSLNF